MVTTMLKAEMLKFQHSKLNQIQRKSSLFQWKISNIQYLGGAAAIGGQQLTFMKSVEGDIIALFFFNYGELTSGIVNVMLDGYLSRCNKFYVMKFITSSLHVILVHDVLIVL